MEPQEWSPGKLLEISGYYWKTCTLHAGVSLDVFTIIGKKQLTSGDVAQKLNGDERAVEMLLNALSAMHLLIKTGDKYANTPSGESLLSKDSSQYIGYMIMHHYHLVESWSQLEHAVKTGKPLRTSSSRGDEKQRESFLMGMFNIGMSIAPELAKQTDLSDRCHLLDLGGGPGTYAIHFCLNNPQLRADIYDLSTTRPFAEKTIEKFGVTDQVRFTEGNYLEDRIEEKYDVAWLSHILHGEGPGDCQNIIMKTVSALSPGGMIMIHDFILDNTTDGPLFPALFSLNMLLGTPHGQSYSEKQIMDMLAKAGAKDIRRIPFRGPTDSGIITGRVE
ncbi:methyltransferase [Desulfonema magnum]|uniref:O-methyltransferase, family II n=1 Tax=Desulfonema magnum TaxID=45655 RepID=A0A975BV54_9BACT|nr:methyltransferase [Desulfonema magnum]QTA92198.1 O-methyltransferase, family II [Desulfonema magnum]